MGHRCCGQKGQRRDTLYMSCMPKNMLPVTLPPYLTAALGVGAAVPVAQGRPGHSAASGAQTLTQSATSS